jgi:hypothetical protein
MSVSLSFLSLSLYLSTTLLFQHSKSDYNDIIETFEVVSIAIFDNNYFKMKYCFN